MSETAPATDAGPDRPAKINITEWSRKAAQSGMFENEGYVTAGSPEMLMAFGELPKFAQEFDAAMANVSDEELADSFEAMGCPVDIICQKCSATLARNWTRCGVCGNRREPAREGETPEEAHECAFCGRPMSRNPHPDAGKPEKLCTVGAIYECIPCCQNNIHRKWGKICDLRKKLEAAERRAAWLESILGRLVAAKREKDRHGETHMYEALKAGAWEEAKEALAAKEGGVTDKDRLDWLQSNSCDLVCFDMPTGQGDADIGWRVIGHHMSEPQERTIGEVFRDDPRAAIDAAMATPPPETT